MVTRSEILEVIYKCIDEINAQNDSGNRLSKKEETVIFGKTSHLDSLGLVNLIVSLEDTVNDEFNLELILADERAMSLESSPFRTVSSLADYILMLIGEHENG